MNYEIVNLNEKIIAGITAKNRQQRSGVSENNRRSMAGFYG